jgi:hypothetical protein
MLPAGALEFPQGAIETLAAAQGDIAKVQDWLDHAKSAATGIYDCRKTKPKDGRLSTS